MNRRLQFLNLVGVAALAALCVAQWRVDRRLNHEVNRLEKTRLERDKKLAEQKQELDGLSTDLSVFKEEFERAQTDLNEKSKALRETEQAKCQLESERDQLKESVTKWAQAVQARDDRIKEANERIGDLITELNTYASKYNDLVTNYNAVVEQFNELRSGKKSKSAATGDNAVAR